MGALALGFYTPTDHYCFGWSIDAGNATPTTKSVCSNSVTTDHAIEIPRETGVAGCVGSHSSHDNVGINFNIDSQGFANGNQALVLSCGHSPLSVQIRRATIRRATIR